MDNIIIYKYLSREIWRILLCKDIDLNQREYEISQFEKAFKEILLLCMELNLNNEKIKSVFNSYTKRDFSYFISQVEAVVENKRSYALLNYFMFRYLLLIWEKLSVSYDQVSISSYSYSDLQNYIYGEYKKYFILLR